METLLRSFLFLLVTLVAVLPYAESGRTMAKTEEDFQNEARFHLWKAEVACNKTINETERPTDGVYCDMVFDNILCWPYTRAGTLAELPCPGALARFNPDVKGLLSQTENATRECLSNGKWASGPPYFNGTDGWTNYSACVLPEPTRPTPPYVPPVIKEHMPKIRLVSRVGYSMSLVSLILAIIIMVYFKRLHCHRNTIHINLFVSFVLRAVVSLLKDSLFVKGLGLPQDLIYDQDGDVSFNKEGTHWECRLLITLFHLALCANYFWIFVEGLYLHTLIFFAVFSKSKTIIRWYMAIGWVTPLLFIIPWVVVRIYENNTLCWNTHNYGFFWIIEGPIIASISVNFFFFLNIIRVLFTKLRAANTRDPQRYKKLARSTLILIPLFGVHYIFFIAISHHPNRSPSMEVVQFYLEMTLSSFQGMVVAFLFCFLNGEVRGEIVKHWNRSRLRRYSTVSMGGRSSRAQSTTSFFLRERPSISQAGPDGGLRRGSSRFPAVDSTVSLRSLGVNGVLPSWGTITEEHQDDGLAETTNWAKRRMYNGLRRNAASAPVFKPCRDSPSPRSRVRPNQNGHVISSVEASRKSWEKEKEEEGKHKEREEGKEGKDKGREEGKRESGKEEVKEKKRERDDSRVSECNNETETSPMIQRNNGHHMHRTPS